MQRVAAARRRFAIARVLFLTARFFIRPTFYSFLKLKAKVRRREDDEEGQPTDAGGERRTERKEEICICGRNHQNSPHSTDTMKHDPAKEEEVDSWNFKPRFAQYALFSGAAEHHDSH